MKTSFREIKIEPLPLTRADALGFFEAVALAGLENKRFRVSSATQKRHFGCIPFGKLGITVKGPIVQTIKAMDFGRDFDTQEAYWSQADRAWRSTMDDRLLNQFPRA